MVCSRRGRAWLGRVSGVLTTNSSLGKSPLAYVLLAVSLFSRYRCHHVLICPFSRFCMFVIALYRLFLRCVVLSRSVCHRPVVHLALHLCGIHLHAVFALVICGRKPDIRLQRLASVCGSDDRATKYPPHDHSYGSSQQSPSSGTASQ